MWLDASSEPPVSRSALPEHWCSITYHELDSPVGESFKAPTKGCPNVQIDGYLEQNDPTRFCLGALNNVQSSKCVETVTKVKLHIGKGILLEKFGKYIFKYMCFYFFCLEKQINLFVYFMSQLFVCLT